MSTSTLATQSAVNAVVWDACNILRRSNCASATQYVPELTWILFLRVLDERELDDDIAKGRRRNCENCPVARAVARLFPAMQVVVSHRFVCLFETAPPRLTSDMAAAVYIASDAAYQWIHDFGDGNSVGPFAFTAMREAQ